MTYAIWNDITLYYIILTCFFIYILHICYMYHIYIYIYVYVYVYGERQILGII